MRIGGGFGQIGKQAQHLLRCFDVPLAVARQQTSGSIERAMIADAGKYVEYLALLRLGVLRTLRRQQRQVQVAGQSDCRLVPRFLRAIVMTL